MYIKHDSVDRSPIKANKVLSMCIWLALVTMYVVSLQDLWNVSLFIIPLPIMSSAPDLYTHTLQNLYVAISSYGSTFYCVFTHYHCRVTVFIELMVPTHCGCYACDYRVCVHISRSQVSGLAM